MTSDNYRTDFMVLFVTNEQKVVVQISKGDADYKKGKGYSTGSTGELSVQDAGGSNLLSFQPTTGEYVTECKFIIKKWVFICK
jgi:hypothetical protein